MKPLGPRPKKSDGRVALGTSIFDMTATYFIFQMFGRCALSLVFLLSAAIASDDNPADGKMTDTHLATYLIFSYPG